jgi:hypothetical protein
MAFLRSPLDLTSEITSANVPLAPQLPSDEIALQIVLDDCKKAEMQSLSKGLTVSWDRDERLYLFRCPQNFWQNSNTPRASLGIPLVLEHIESLLPQYMQALFSDDPPFKVDPRPKTSIDAARAVKQIIAKQLKDIGFKEEIRLGLKESLTYGMGVWKIGWKREKHFRRTYKYAEPPEIVSVGIGMTVTKPTKKSREVVQTIEEYETNRPYIEKVHIRWLLVDPSLRVPDIRKAKYVIHRMYMTLQDLEQLRNQPGYNLPPEAELAKLFDPPKESPERSIMEGRSTSSVLNTGVSSLDINQEFKAAPRWQETSVDPTQQPLEVLEYVTDTKVIVVLNRKLTIKNAINDYGMINFLSVPPIDVLDSWYGIGIAKLLSGEQRLQMGIINARLDDLSLRLSGTFLRKRGANTPTQQLTLRPGGIIDSDDEKGIQMIQYPPAITDAFTEVEASDSRAQRRSGANEIVTQGTLTAPSSITRSATGVNTLAAGVGARSAYFIDFMVMLVFVPFLEFVHESNSRWLSVEEIEEILDDVLVKAFEGDALEIKNANVKFSMEAGTKLRAKAALQQIVPQLIQLLAAAPVLTALQDQEMKVNFVKLIQQFLDATDWPGEQEIVAPMTQQDKDLMKQKSEAAVQNNQINLKHQATMEEIEAKGVSQSGTHVIKALLEELTHSPQDKVQLAQAVQELLQTLQSQQGNATGTQNPPAGGAGAPSSGSVQ